MRARLERMNTGQEFDFICDEKMAEKIGRIISLNGGEIVTTNPSLIGTVITVRKQSTIEPPS